MPDNDKPTEKIRLETRYGKRRAALGTELIRVKAVFVARWISRATRGMQIKATVAEKEGSSTEYAGVEGIGYRGKILPVMVAVAKNVTVATIDRIDSLETPQSICPLVQPELRRLPKPTRIPANASLPLPIVSRADKACPGNRALTPVTAASAGPATNPPTTAHLQPSRSPSTALFTIPDMPKTRPVSWRSWEVDKWSSTAPTNEWIGVKGMVILSSIGGVG